MFKGVIERKEKFSNFNQKTEFLLAFDIPTPERYFKKKINLLLKSCGAKMVQRSLWKSDNLKELIRIAILIKNVGGKARVLEEKLIFE